MCLETIRVISGHARTSRTPLMASRRLHLDPVGGISEEAPEAGLRKSGTQKGDFLPSHLLWFIADCTQVETSPGHQRSARGLDMVRDDSNSPQACPRPCRNAFHGSPRATRDLHGSGYRCTRDTIYSIVFSGANHIDLYFFDGMKSAGSVFFCCYFLSAIWGRMTIFRPIKRFLADHTRTF